MQLIYNPPLLCVEEMMLASVVGILVNYLSYMVRKIFTVHCGHSKLLFNYTLSSHQAPKCFLHVI